MAADVEILQLRIAHSSLIIIVCSLTAVEDASWRRGATSISEVCEGREALTGCFILLLPTSSTIRTQDLHSLSSTFGIPTSTWADQYRNATGYFLADEKRSSNGEFHSYVTASRFLIKNVTSDTPKSPELQEGIKYEWTHIGLWTQWRPRHSSALICSLQDYGGLSVWERIWQALQDQDHPLQLDIDRPFDWQGFILPHVTKAFDIAVWSCRDRIRYLEQHRPAKNANTRPHYESMHEVARHAIHITETLTMSIKVLENVIQEVQDKIETFGQDVVLYSEKKHQNESARVLPGLRCQKTLLECSHGRAEALTARLQNEINLAFHLGAERDSAIAAQMAGSMQQDSTAMKTISVLGLIFLPGAFVSSIFGMTFFNFTPSEPSGWLVSDQFWIYWAITVPLTLMTVVVWWLWFSKGLR